MQGHFKFGAAAVLRRENSINLYISFVFYYSLQLIQVLRKLIDLFGQDGYYHSNFQ